MKAFVFTLIVLLISLFMFNEAKAGTFIHGRYYPDYGIVNEGKNRSHRVCYDLSVGSALVGIIFAPTIVVPAYVVGWHLMKPVRPLHGPNDYCSSFMD